MKRLLGLLCFLSGMITSFGAGLNGTYTIDPKGSGGKNYKSFKAAIDELNLNGVSGSVIFNIAEGIYSESIILHNINGASYNNSIIFQSSSKDSSKVILTSPSSKSKTKNGTVWLDSIQNVHFKGIGIHRTGSNPFAAVVELGSNVFNCSFENCFIKGIQSSSQYADLVYNVGTNDSAIVIKNSALKYGYIAINLNGWKNAATNSNSTATNDSFIGNIIDSQKSGGIYLHHQLRANISNNIIYGSDSSDSRGILLHDCYLMQNISKNKIILPNGGIGLYFDSVASDRTVSNNLVSINCNLPLDYKKRLGIFATYCGCGLTIVHNSICIYGKDSNGAGIYLLNNYCVYTFNNIISNNAGGYAIAIEPKPHNLDFNNYYTTGNHIGICANHYLKTLFDWQAFGLTDGNSLNSAPHYLTNIDLHIGNSSLNGVARGSSIIDDYDGNIRNHYYPDMGAYEFNSSVSLNCLKGSYSIGKTGQDYSTISEAVGELVAKGICGPVIFNLEDGDYIERVRIDSIPGSSHVNTVTFQSKSLDSSKVTIKFSDTIIPSNHVIRLNRCDNIIIQYLTIQKLDGLLNVLDISELSDNIKILHNRIISIFSKGINSIGDSNLMIIGNYVQGNNLSLSIIDLDETLTGNSSRVIKSADTKIALNQIVGADLILQGNNLSFIGNRVHYRYNTGSGILFTCSNSFFADNILEGGKNCIDLRGNYNKIINNMIISPSAIVTAYNTAYTKIINNTFFLNGAYNAIYLDNMFSNHYKDSIFNNIFYNLNSGGIAIRLSHDSDYYIDFNDYYCKGGVTKYRDKDYLNLLSWHSATKFDSNSVSMDPKFYSSADLHIKNDSLRKGLHVPYLVNDIDGDKRDAKFPTIGADEITGILTTDNSLNFTTTDLKISPNPCREFATISYNLIKSETIVIEVVDLFGRKIFPATAYDEFSGLHIHEFNFSTMADGIYFVKIKTRKNITTLKIIHLK